MSLVQEHVQWRNAAPKPQVEAPQSSVAEGVDGADSAWFADECNRVLAQELSPEDEKMNAGLFQEAKLRDLAAWGKFDVYFQRNARNVSKEIAQTRWVLTWKMVDDKKRVKARLLAEGFQDPDLQEGPVGTSGCVNLRSPHLQVIPLSAIRIWNLWSSDNKNEFLQADGFGRDVFRYAPDEWEPSCQGRVWKL